MLKINENLNMILASMFFNYNFAGICILVKPKTNVVSRSFPKKVLNWFSREYFPIYNYTYITFNDEYSFLTFLILLERAERMGGSLHHLQFDITSINVFAVLLCKSTNTTS